LLGCKDKQKCKHACCKIGCVQYEGGLFEEQKTGEKKKGQEKDLIDENLDFIDAVLENAQKSPHKEFPHIFNGKKLCDVLSQLTLKIKEKHQ